MAAVTICSDFGAPKNKVCHCFPIYLPWSDGTRCHDLHFLNVVAAAAKSLQSNTTLCDPRDGSPPGSPVPGILQARTLEWVAISFSNAWKWKVKSEVAQSCLILCDPMNRSTPGLPVHHQLLEFTQTHVHWVSDTIQPSYPLSSPSPSAVSLSQHQGLFKWVSSSHQVAKYRSFSFSIRPSKEIPGLISFRMDWLYLLAVQGTLKSLLQHHSSKASILQCSAFFIVQLSHPYMTTGKTIALTRQTFSAKWCLWFSIHCLGIS